MIVKLHAGVKGTVISKELDLLPMLRKFELCLLLFADHSSLQNQIFLYKLLMLDFFH